MDCQGVLVAVQRLTLALSGGGETATDLCLDHCAWNPRCPPRPLQCVETY